MKIAIIGSREITSIDLSVYLPIEVEEIISGGAKGIDTLAEQYADQHLLSKHIIRPDYKHYGRAAPLIRNKQIIDLADHIYVFWDGHSKGTQYCINYIHKVGKKYTLIDHPIK